VNWILVCKLRKFGEYRYVCYNFRDVEFFLGGYFFMARPVHDCMIAQNTYYKGLPVIVTLKHRQNILPPVHLHYSTEYCGKKQEANGPILNLQSSSWSNTAGMKGRSDEILHLIVKDHVIIIFKFLQHISVQK